MYTGRAQPFLNILASLEVTILLINGNSMEVKFISCSREKAGK